MAVDSADPDEQGADQPAKGPACHEKLLCGASDYKASAQQDDSSHTEMCDIF